MPSLLDIPLQLDTSAAPFTNMGYFQYKHAYVITFIINFVNIEVISSHVLLVMW